MDFSLLLNYQGIWSDVLSYAVQPLFGVEPLTFISPVVEYNNNLYVANYHDGQNPPVGAVPGVSSLWTLFTTGAMSAGVTSFNTRTGAVTAQTGDYGVSQVTGAAPLAGPIFSGTVMAPVLLLSDNTNFLEVGGSNTTIFTMASLTATRVFTLPDADSNSVQPSTAPTNEFATGIDSSGVIQYAQPSAANFGYTVAHPIANYQFLVSDILVIMDADAQTGTLPQASDVVPGAVTYVLKLGVGATTGTLAVPPGNYLNNVLNGTFAISGAKNSASARSDGATWFTV
jgi:hypothetical protein